MEEYKLLLKNIGKLIDLNSKEQALVTSIFHFEKLKPKTALVKKGEITSRTYFINEGCIRAFTVEDDGTEYSLYFASKDWWISEMYSYISGNPAQQNIETVLPCEVLYAEKKDMEKLMLKVPKLERFFRILIERSVVAHQQRIIDNLTKTAEERYHQFEKKYPTLVNTIPQKQIATFLGVTPEFFSKMKGRMLRGK